MKIHRWMIKTLVLEFDDLLKSCTPTGLRSQGTRRQCQCKVTWPACTSQSTRGCETQVVNVPTFQTDTSPDSEVHALLILSSLRRSAICLLLRCLESI